MSRTDLPLVEITPQDREVYLIVTNGVIRGGNDALVCAMVRRGVDDKHPAMQAIAHHRLMSIATAASEIAAGAAAKVAEDKAAQYMAIGSMTDDFVIRMQAKRGAKICTNIAEAIRRLTPAPVQHGGTYD